MKKETKLSISQVFVYLVLLFVFVFFSVLSKDVLVDKESAEHLSAGLHDRNLRGRHDYGSADRRY